MDSIQRPRPVELGDHLRVVTRGRAPAGHLGQASSNVIASGGPTRNSRCRALRARLCKPEALPAPAPNHRATTWEAMSVAGDATSGERPHEADTTRGGLPKTQPTQRTERGGADVPATRRRPVAPRPPPSTRSGPGDAYSESQTEERAVDTGSVAWVPSRGDGGFPVVVTGSVPQGWEVFDRRRVGGGVTNQEHIAPLSVDHCPDATIPVWISKRSGAEARAGSRRQKFRLNPF
jgi:hypothetical protein